MASISLIADGLIRILYFPTPFQLPNDLFKVAILLLRTRTKSSQVLGIFGEGQFNCLVYDIRNGAVSHRGLQAQSTVEISIKINSGAFGGSGHTPHFSVIASKRQIWRLPQAFGGQPWVSFWQLRHQA